MILFITLEVFPASCYFLSLRSMEWLVNP